MYHLYIYRLFHTDAFREEEEEDVIEEEEEGKGGLLIHNSNNFKCLKICISSMTARYILSHSHIHLKVQTKVITPKRKKKMDSEG
jgi:hypothetical protein